MIFFILQIPLIISEIIKTVDFLGYKFDRNYDKIVKIISSKLGPKRLCRNDFQKIKYPTDALKHVPQKGKFQFWSFSPKIRLAKPPHINPQF